jgi:phage/plasmid-like protein (TIGR03299 family)
MNTQLLKENTKFSMTQIPGGSATVEEALKIGQADWEVDKLPVYDGFMNPIEGFSRIARKDNDSTLNICKSSYEPIQNHEIFGVIDDILGQSQAQIERVGMFQGGKIVFMQAKMPQQFEVLKGDGMDMYLNAITSHNGSQLARIFFGSTRVICQNQMRAIQKERSERSLSIRHTKNAAIKVANASEILMDGVREWNVIKENAQILARKSVTRQETKDFVEALFPAPVEMDKRDPNAKKREKMFELIEAGMGTEIPGVKGTAWGIFNAATEYLDHYAPTRSNGSRFYRSMISGDKFRDQALSLAMA